MRSSSSSYLTSYADRPSRQAQLLNDRFLLFCVCHFVYVCASSPIDGGFIGELIDFRVSTAIGQSLANAKRFASALEALTATPLCLFVETFGIFRSSAMINQHFWWPGPAGLAPPPAAIPSSIETKAVLENPLAFHNYHHLQQPHHGIMSPDNESSPGWLHGTLLDGGTLRRPSSHPSIHLHHWIYPFVLLNLRIFHEMALYL